MSASGGGVNISVDRYNSFTPAPRHFTEGDC